MVTKVNILHLSDLHFGAEPTNSISSHAVAKRKNTLAAFIESLNSINTELRPNIVVISGDIAWKGRRQDYDKAKTWLRKLLRILDLTPEDLILCAGNHDIDERKLGGLGLPKSAKQADEWLDPGQEGLQNLTRPFQNYLSFCEDFRIPKPSIGIDSCYLLGHRETRGLKFLILNSAWFCRRKDDEGNIDDNKKLWIGLPHLEVMQGNGELVNPSRYDESKITVAVHHHPPEWLHDSEINAYQGRKNTYQYLAERCHIVLSGHAHPEAVQPANRWAQAAYVFKGGAIYVGNNYSNIFSILQIDLGERLVYAYYYTFLPAEGRWAPYDKNPKIYSLLKDPLKTFTKRSRVRSSSIPFSGHRILYRDESVIQEIREQVSTEVLLSDHTILDLTTTIPSKNVKQVILQIEAQTSSTPVEDLIHPGMHINLCGYVQSQDDISLKEIHLREGEFEVNVALDQEHSLNQASHVLRERSLYILGIVEDIKIPIVKAGAIILRQGRKISRESESAVPKPSKDAR